MTVNAAAERPANGAPEGAGGAPTINKRALAAFIITTLVVVIVLAMLPAAISSMVTEMRGQGTDEIHDLFTGAEADPDEVLGPDTAFVNITAMSLDEGRRVAALTPGTGSARPFARRSRAPSIPWATTPRGGAACRLRPR